MSEASEPSRRKEVEKDDTETKSACGDGLLFSDETVLRCLVSDDLTEGEKREENWTAFSEGSKHVVGTAAESFARVREDYKDIFPIREGNITRSNDARQLGEEVKRSKAISHFYKKEYKESYKFFNHTDEEIDIVLMRIECGIHRGGRLEEIWKWSKIFDKVVKRDIGEISQWQFLRWIRVLRRTNRPFGTILLCRALSITFPNFDESGCYLRLAYSLFAEMALTATTVLESGRKTNGFVLRSLGVVYSKLKLIRAGDLWNKEKAKMEAVCCNLLGFICNTIGLYESAKKWISEGLRDSRELEHRVYPDLLVNYGLTHLLQGRSSSAAYKFETAKWHYVEIGVHYPVHLLDDLLKLSARSSVV